ncbi:DNA polymerase epsilon catalytic subunit A [Capsicum annuum]
MLNVDVARNYTNDQYQTLKDPINKMYTIHSECSIEFEVDEPYKAMILPASKEEGILIKKCYAVFNDDGTLAELKGFEIKRRGELKLIKVFQAELFDKFLHGSTLEECYSAVASVADRWLDLHDNQGQDIADSELLGYISESSTMSKSLADYGEQKSCAVTTAKRLADFLGDAMVKDTGLLCQYIVACEPKGTPVSERAIPVAIFETNAEIMRFYVKKWCKISSEDGIRSIIDWSYYKQRLSSVIQKIITIPAAMQKVSNPVPRVVHPDWLHKKVREKEDKFRQQKLNDIFCSVNTDDTVASKHSKDQQNCEDLEDFRQCGKSSIFGPRPVVHRHGVNKEHPLSTSDQLDSRQQNGHACSLSKVLPSQEIAAVEDIDRNVDYNGWLQQKKRKWKENREERKHQRLDTPKTVNHANGSTDMLHNMIVQLEPTSQHGQFFAWVVVGGVMHNISVTTPRVFYLNSKTPITEEFPGRRVNKILPHGRHSYNLIEVTIDEHQFKSDVEGIYETKVPLEFSAILQMGCVCKVDKATKKRNPQDGWSLSELHMKTTTECSYLDQSIAFFYLYHSVSDVRAIYVGHFPTSMMIHVVVVNPFQNRELSPHILERHFYEACQTLSGQKITQKEGISFKVDYVGYIKDAERILQRAITEHRHHGPAIAMIECPNTHLLKSGIRALEDFPCISIPCNARDSQYQALCWQNVAAKIGMQRCATSSQWLNERITLSRYAHVPIGNFDVDWLMHTADIFFSRALRDQQQVLWISDNGIPDLGGVNDEVSSFMDEVNQPVLTYPGAYRKVTVELKIHHLSVNSLLKSNQVNEMERGTLFGLDQDLNPMTNFTNEQYFSDVTTSCAPAFRVLKQLIQRCITDAVTSGNIFADAMLQHLYRWLCRELFEWIELEPLQFWHSLLFMDQYNYGGIQAKLSDGSVENSQPGEESVWGESQVDIVSSWNIAENLPKATQDHFILIVSEFMYIPWKYAREHAALRASTSDGDLCTPSITAALAETFDLQMAEDLKKKIRTYFTDKLLKIVCALNLQMKVLNNSQKNQETPDANSQPYSHVEKGDPALEFIKHVCAVLALDKNVQHEVLIMRRNLLKLVRVREFAPEAEFRSLSVSYTLPNVICSYCNDCRDLDLCRDRALISHEWRCAVPQCGQPYDREAMENALVQIVRQREKLYHLQDLVCLKCHQIKAAHLSDHCACAGAFTCEEDLSDFRNKMQVFLNIAVNLKFQLLQECTSWILEAR